MSKINIANRNCFLNIILNSSKRFYTNQILLNNKNLLFNKTFSTKITNETKTQQVQIPLIKSVNEKDFSDLNNKKFFVTGKPIKPKETPFVYFVNPETYKENKKLLNDIKENKFLLLMGSQMSGKSTQIYSLIQQLHKEGYICLFTSFANISTKKSEFWENLYKSLRRTNIKYFQDDKNVKSSDDFLDVFIGNEWKKKVIIFIDDFDGLYNTTSEIQDDCLHTFQCIKNSIHNYAISSIVAIGTFSIQYLKSSKIHISPFTIKKSYSNPKFSKQHINALFNEFMQEEAIIIDDKIIDDIYMQTNGHPGLVCIYGYCISENLLDKVDADTRHKKLDFKTWQTYVIESLHKDIWDFPIFEKLRNSLLNQNENTKNIIQLLQTQFLSNLEPYNFIKKDKNKWSDLQFLVKEGILENENQISSPLFRSFILQHIMPKNFEKPLSQLLQLLQSKEILDEEILRSEEILQSKEILQPKEILQSKEISQPKEILQPKEISQSKEILQPKEISQSKEILQPEGISQSKEILQPEGISQSKEILQPEGISQLKEILQCKDGSIDILKLLIWTLQVFNKEYFTSAKVHSCKKPKVMVTNNNNNNILVPRESVYHQELAIIIANWLKDWNVISQFRTNNIIKEDEKQRCINCNLMITAPEKPSAIIEILATETQSDLNKHFDQILEYAQSLDPKFNVRDIWIVHFTCENRITMRSPWPKKEQQEAGLNVIHIWHDIDFTTARISARWKDNNNGKMLEIMDEKVF